MQRYLVGGAVRDELLDLKFTDQDWLVTGATPEQMLKAGYLYADKEAYFPVFKDPKTGDEVALARREIKKKAGYRGFEIEADPSVTLEEDLKRRDLTINAIAKDQQGYLIDPFNGQEDLNQGLLRHVSPAFIDDPVRLLRIARFAAKLGCWGFSVAHGTHGLMKKMACSEELQALQAPRIWRELKKSLNEPQPWQFFRVLHHCHALEILFPELAKSMGTADGHKTKIQNNPLKALQLAQKQGIKAELKYALVFYFSQGLDNPEAEKSYQLAFQQLLDFGQGMALLEIEKAPQWWQFLKQFNAFKSTQNILQLNQCFKIIIEVEGGKQELFNKVRLLEKIVNAGFVIDIKKLQAEGYQGAELGRRIIEEQVGVIDFGINKK